MENILDILKPLIPALILVWFVGSRVYSGYWMKKRLKEILTLSTEELKDRLCSQKNAFYGAIIAELKRRNESYSEVLPNLFELLLSGNRAMRTFGWIIFSNHFPEMSKDIKYNAMFLSEETKRELKRLRDIL